MKLLMLDTDISSYIIRRRPEPLAHYFERHADEICVSVITAAELRFGVADRQAHRHHGSHDRRSRHRGGRGGRHQQRATFRRRAGT